MSNDQNDLETIQNACRHFVRCAVTPEARANAWEAFHGWIVCDRIVASSCLMALTGPCCVTTDDDPEPEPEMVFTMGLPAAGKSTYVKNELAETHMVIDPDTVKETLPGYDPKNPGAVHAESKVITDAMLDAAMTAGAGRYVVDGTGTNPDSMLRDFARARDAGFTVRLVYIECSLTTSLARNAARERFVPPTIIEAKAAVIVASFDAIKDHADTVTTVNTDDLPVHANPYWKGHHLPATAEDIEWCGKQNDEWYALQDLLGRSGY